MAKEASIAPKERVNIVYKPATGGAQEEVELPLKFIAMGDYTLRPDERPLEDRKPINIDKDNFNEVMKAQDLDLAFNVANKLVEEEDAEMALNLKFDTLKDFEPESVAKQVPELNKLLELREALLALKGPLGNVPAFRKKVQGMLSDKRAREKMLEELGAGKEEDSGGEE
ncbi:type VI secretion system contractile sheath small subunit [Thermodesulfobacteriota bacterium]